MLQHDALQADALAPANWPARSSAWPFERQDTADPISVALDGYERLHGESLQICIEQTSDMAFAGNIPDDPLPELDYLDQSVIVLSHQSTVLATVERIRAIQAHQTGASIVVSGVPANPICNIRYLESGAHGYVYSHESTDQLLNVVRMVARGQPRLGEDLTAPLLARLVELSEQLGHFQLVPEDPVPLSQREEEVALEISKGRSNQEIADDLFISTGTVKNHVHRILRKLNVKDRRQAGIIYRQLSEREAGEQPEDRPIPA